MDQPFEFEKLPGDYNQGFGESRKKPGKSQSVSLS